MTNEENGKLMESTIKNLFYYNEPYRIDLENAAVAYRDSVAGGFDLPDNKESFLAGAKWCEDNISEIIKGMSTAIPKAQNEQSDPRQEDVSLPSHYAMEGGLEVIEVMRMNFGMEAVYDFCLLNATKYILRCNKKHKTPLTDLKKARWYLDYIINNKEAEERKEGQNDNR